MLNLEILTTLVGVKLIKMKAYAATYKLVE